MKKIIVIILALITVLTLTSCNMGAVGSYTFTDIHICDFGGNACHAKIIKWYDGEEGIEVSTEEFGQLFLSEGTYILFNGTCPICEKEGKK